MLALYFPHMADPFSHMAHRLPDSAVDPMLAHVQEGQ
jgi:hypothetical protein